MIDTNTSETHRCTFVFVVLYIRHKYISKTIFKSKKLWVKRSFIILMIYLESITMIVFVYLRHPKTKINVWFLYNHLSIIVCLSIYILKL